MKKGLSFFLSFFLSFSHVYAQDPFDLSAGQKIQNAYQCSGGEEETRVKGDIAKLKELSTDLILPGRPECKSLYPIPAIEDLMLNRWNNEKLKKIAVAEKEISELQETLDFLAAHPNAPERNWLENEDQLLTKIYGLKAQIVEIKRNLAIDVDGQLKEDIF